MIKRSGGRWVWCQGLGGPRGEGFSRTGTAGHWDGVHRSRLTAQLLNILLKACALLL